METTTYFYYTLITITLYFFTAYFLRKLQKTPPSPSLCFPVIGHFNLLKEPINQTFANLANRYGPVLLLQFGSRPVLMVSSPEAAEECLNKNDVVFCNRPSGFLAGKHLGYDYTSLNWAPYGPHWRNLRKLSALELLSSHRLQSLAGIRADEVKLLIKQLFKVSSFEHVVEMNLLLINTTMNVMTRMIFGKRYYGVEEINGGEAERFRNVVAGTFKLFNEVCIGDMIPYLRWLDRKKERKFKEFKVEREMLMRELIEEQREEMKVMDNGEEKSKKVKPLIQVLLELQSKEPEYYKDDIILGIMLDLLVGGSDTTAGTIEWVLSLLLNHPEVLKKAQTEIDTYVGHERLLDESDVNNLPYLRCIINETLRMYPAAPNLVPHESSEDCTVGGYRIRRGTMLQVNLWAIQNDPMIWDEPESFRPERFEGLEGHKIGFKMMPFGSGRRSCPGEGLAIRVVGLAIGSLIQCFEWKRIDENLSDMTKAPGFNMRMARPLCARLQPRPSMMKLLVDI